MGMDVYGASGNYFHRNVWGWRPLWDFCTDKFEVARQVKHGQSNDGDGLNGRNARILAEGILASIADGSAKEYIEVRNATLEALERETCKICNGTGIRIDSVGIDMAQDKRALSDEQVARLGRTHGWCNGCDGEGTVEPWAKAYYLALEDLKEFADFLSESQGFEIC